VINAVFKDVSMFLPKFLSDAGQAAFFEELKLFPYGTNKKFYTSYLQQNNMLYQGDGFSGVIIPDHDSKQFRECKAVLISNTCDVSIDNSRSYAIHLCFAPIISLSKFTQLISKNLNEQNTNSLIESIRGQKVSKFFYLPPGVLTTVQNRAYMPQAQAQISH